MVHSHLEKALALVRRTGDRIIVADRYDENAGCVVMSIDEYERLLDEAEGDDNCDNGDDWRDERWPDINENDKDEDDDLADFSEEDALFDQAPPDDDSELDNRDEYGTIGDTFNGRPEQKNRWEIAGEVRRAGEAARQRAGVEDERYYLEDI